MSASERGHDRYRPAHPGDQGAVAELEDLGLQPVAPRGRSASGWRGPLAATAVVVLLGAGLGVFGGRPEPWPSPAATTSGAASATPNPIAHPFPMVTPWADCAAAPGVAPEVLLEVNGDATPGAVETVPWPGPGFTPAAIATPLPDVARILVPVDANAELWITGGACANEWTIDADYLLILDSVYNPSLDVGYAAQNRFRLSLASYGLRDVAWDFELAATLRFAGLAVRATWPVRVPAFPLPNATLSSRRVTANAVGGCDVMLFLRNGWLQDREHGCREDIGNWLVFEAPLEVAKGETLSFRLEPWFIDTAHVVCGRMSGSTFMGPADNCGFPPGVFMGSVDLAAPAAVGPWTLAIEACAEDERGTGNQICGTWYVNVEVRA